MDSRVAVFRVEATDNLSLKSWGPCSNPILASAGYISWAWRYFYYCTFPKAKKEPVKKQWKRDNIYINHQGLLDVCSMLLFRDVFIHMNII